jgi:predicted anti-sigma-YlaC factor YlaD
MSTDADCAGARRELSAARDGEQALGEAARRHLAGCGACRVWAARLDRVTARVRVDAVHTPDVLPAALDVWDAEAARDDRMPGRRALLAVAGVACLAVAAGHLAGIAAITAADAHSSRELAAIDAALGVAFLLAAWRPRRFAAGLAPLAAVLALLLVVAATVDVLTGHASLIGEVVHLPSVVGALALLGVWRRAAEPDPAPAAAGRRSRQGAAA